MTKACSGRTWHERACLKCEMRTGTTEQKAQWACPACGHLCRISAGGACLMDRAGGITTDERRAEVQAMKSLGPRRHRKPKRAGLVRGSTIPARAFPSLEFLLRRSVQMTKEGPHE